jgi:hypothetical protein
VVTVPTTRPRQPTDRQRALNLAPEADAGRSQRPNEPARYWSLEIQVVLAGVPAGLAFCGACACLAPATDAARRQHDAFHDRLGG